MQRNLNRVGNIRYPREIPPLTERVIEYQTAPSLASSSMHDHLCKSVKIEVVNQIVSLTNSSTHYNICVLIECLKDTDSSEN